MIAFSTTVLLHVPLLHSRACMSTYPIPAFLLIQSHFFLSQEVLKSDNDNYMALILIGAAYQDTDKATSAKYLRKAVSNTNEPLIALQGLSNCAPNEELLEIYEKLLELTP